MRGHSRNLLIVFGFESGQRSLNADPGGGEKLSESQTGFVSSLLCLNTSHLNTSAVALKVLSYEVIL